ncbi:hypothetical protein LUX57_38345 [Actinomadura madurae]|uniref:hypothetical protein n=1 Tax=Actinomadura madurae TaxID=1993 RepID=UPI0020D23487|nr:hypothetical protein [Actinomadura madurae]MCP9970327.1 hypothetical protein [Actinomadura madurae]
MSILLAAFFALGVACAGISFFGASARGAVGGASDGPNPVGRSEAAGRIPSGTAKLSDGIVPVAQVHGRVTVVALAAPSPVDWDEKKERIKTVDDAPGADLQWDEKTGRVRVCDREADGHLARGEVSAGGTVLLENRDLRAAGKGRCNEARIPNYNLDKRYSFKVCLGRSDDQPNGYCNMSDNKNWAEPEREEMHCLKVWQETEQRGDEGPGPTVECVGGVDEYCRDFAGRINTLLGWEDKCIKRVTKELADKAEGKALEPPKGKRKPDKYFITNRPDAEMPRGNAKKVGEVAEPVGPVLGWLVWSALGGCVLGFIMVGGKMAIKHRRGEVGAHVTELGWVFLACVIAGSGFAMALISLLVDPL